MFFPVVGLFHSLVPSASPMKFATPIGACLSNSLQLIWPAVVSMIAVGPVGTGPVDLGAAFLAFPPAIVKQERTTAQHRSFFMCQVTFRNQRTIVIETILTGSCGRSLRSSRG